MRRCPPMPTLVWEVGPCSECGAATEAEAATACVPSSDETGERSCPGEFDQNRNSIIPTQSSIAALDAWIDVHHDCIAECLANDKSD